MRKVTMEVIPGTLESLELGPATSFRNMTVFPLIWPQERSVGYLTLDEAIEKGVARVTEVNEGGHVPELAFVNEGQDPVLLLDGEELVGAKQNRVLNLSILVPPHESLVIPVSCVEQGRWGFRGARGFSSAPHVMYYAARRYKAAQVSDSLAYTGMASSNQAAVWNAIDQKMGSLGVQSRSGAMSDIFERHRGEVENYVRAFAHLPDQVGCVFALGGRILGMEVLDHPATMRRLLPKLVRSYALDAIEVRETGVQPPPAQAARDFIAEVASADTRAGEAVGLGSDVRISGRRLAGGALVHDGRVVHLGAFRLEEQASEGGGHGDSRMSSYSDRLRRWRRVS